MVSLEDLEKQTDAAHKAVAEAHQESLRLIEVKQQCGIAEKAHRLKALKDRLEEVKDEEKKLEDTEQPANASVQESAKAALSALEEERKKVKEQIEVWEASQPKDWSATKQDFENYYQQIQTKLDKITGEK
jgi:DNA repair exonuclease SbcCD ATPase subunit